MNTTTPILDRALHRIHRRWILVRAVERIGFCILLSSALAIVLSLSLIFRGESSIDLTGICLALGVLAGLLVSWMARPSVFDTAVEVDRQLKLADLLATALSICQSKTIIADELDFQWSRSILALAESRCQNIASESLILHRFGLRAWGGIGLSTAIVLSLAMLSTNPLVLQAAKVHSNLNPSTPSTTTPQLPSIGSEQAHDPQHSPEPESADHSQIGPENLKNGKTSGESGNQSSAGASDSTATGSARTDSVPSSESVTLGNTAAKAGTTGESATGGGETARDGSTGDASNSRAADASQTPAPPPWSSPDWPQAQQRASDDVRSGQVPDVYRDLVRDYFSR